MATVSSLCLIVILVRGFGYVLDTLRTGALMTIVPLVLDYRSPEAYEQLYHQQRELCLTPCPQN